MEIPAAGGIVFDECGRLLLIRRGRPPSAGSWSVPGGKCEPGEPPATACVREVAEETGLQVVVERFAGRVRRPASSGHSYLIDDFVCRLVGGTLLAADDASEAGWFGLDHMAKLELVPGLLEALDDWQLLPE